MSAWSRMCEVLGSRPSTTPKTHYTEWGRFYKVIILKMPQYVISGNFHVWKSLKLIRSCLARGGPGV